MTKPADTLSAVSAGILNGTIRVIDLTVPLEPATPVIRLPPQFAPSNAFSMTEISRYDERGPAWYWNNFACGEHTGTHFDAPVHWVTGKDYPNNATHTIPVDRFIGPACVIDVAEGTRANSDFLLTHPHHRGVGGPARAHSRTCLGADSHGLVQTHQSRGVSQHQGRWPAHSRDPSQVRAVPGEGARHNRLGSGDGRHRRRPGGDLRPHVPLPHDHARRQQIRARKPHQSRSAAADGRALSSPRRSRS